MSVKPKLSLPLAPPPLPSPLPLAAALSLHWCPQLSVPGSGRGSDACRPDTSLAPGTCPRPEAESPGAPAGPRACPRRRLLGADELMRRGGQLQLGLASPCPRQRGAVACVVQAVDGAGSSGPETRRPRKRPRPLHRPDSGSFWDPPAPRGRAPAGPRLLAVPGEDVQGRRSADRTVVPTSQRKPNAGPAPTKRGDGALSGRLLRRPLLHR